MLTDDERKRVEEIREREQSQEIKSDTRLLWLIDLLDRAEREIESSAKYHRETLDRGNRIGEQYDALKAKLEQMEQELADIHDATRVVMEEKCAPDEQHCTCVPILRSENAKLKVDLKMHQDHLLKSRTSEGIIRRLERLERAEQENAKLREAGEKRG